MQRQPATRVLGVRGPGTPQCRHSEYHASESCTRCLAATHPEGKRRPHVRHGSAEPKCPAGCTAPLRVGPDAMRLDVPWLFPRTGIVVDARNGLVLRAATLSCVKVFNIGVRLSSASAGDGRPLAAGDSSAAACRGKLQEDACADARTRPLRGLRRTSANVRVRPTPDARWPQITAAKRTLDDKDKKPPLRASPATGRTNAPATDVPVDTMLRPA